MDFHEIARMGAEPTPATIVPFLVEVLERQGGAASRSDLVRAVEKRWAEASGSPMPSTSATFKVKKALRNMQDQRIVVNPVTGYYRLADADAAAMPAVNVEDADVLTERVEAEEVEAEDSAIPEVQLGEGPQYVYAYYLPTYRRIAEKDGLDRWPVKIGMTTTSVAVRMAAHRTALPEAPRLGLIVRTDNAALLENVIHGVLSMRGARSEESGGSEWFVTNLDEVVAIYQFAVGPDQGVAKGHDLADVLDES